MDERVRKELVQCLSAFDGALPELGRVIAQVDAILASDVSISESEQHAFREEWEILEQIYAAAIDQGTSVLDEHDRVASIGAAHNLASLFDG